MEFSESFYLMPISLTNYANILLKVGPDIGNRWQYISYKLEGSETYPC